MSFTWALLTMRPSDSVEGHCVSPAQLTVLGGSDRSLRPSRCRLRHCPSCRPRSDLTRHRAASGADRYLSAMTALPNTSVGAGVMARVLRPLVDVLAAAPAPGF